MILEKKLFNPKISISEGEPDSSFAIMRVIESIVTDSNIEETVIKKKLKNTLNLFLLEIKEIIFIGVLIDL